MSRFGLWPRPRLALGLLFYALLLTTKSCDADQEQHTFQGLTADEERYIEQKCSYITMTHLHFHCVMREQETLMVKRTILAAMNNASNTEMTLPMGHEQMALLLANEGFSNDGRYSGQPNPALSSQFVIPAAKAPQEWRHQHHRTYFKLEHTQKSEVKTAMLNVFVKNMNGDDGKSKFTIYVNKYLDENTVSTEGQIVFAKHHVMNGDQWEQIEVTDIINEWINNPDTNYGMQVKVIPDGNGVAFFDPIDRHSNNSQYFLEVVQMPNLRKRRELQHDNGSQICTIDPSHPDSYCCRYHLEIDFKDFEWGFVIAPSKYTAYYCAGRCRPGQSAKTLHARFMEIKMPQHMCCAPDKLGDFKLFHKGPGSNTAVVTTIRNMVVQSCGCK
ncbi:unnamed protein product, partial [Mesorhabditis spiculigera]